MIASLYPPPAMLKAAGIVRTGLLAEYRFDEGSGNTVLDHSGGGNDMTAYPGYTPAWNARGIAFANLVMRPPAALYQAAITKQWFLATDRRDAQYGGIAGNGSGDGGFSFRCGSAQVFKGSVGAPTVQSVKPVTGNVSLALVGGSPARAYVNGAEVDYLIQLNFAYEAATEFWVGFTTSSYYSGEMWYALMYDHALSSAELLRNHNAVAATLAGRGVSLSGGLAASRVAFVGDSRTLSVVNSNAGQYPTVAMGGLVSRWTNLGIGGATTSLWSTNTSRPILALAGSAGPAAVVWLGTNDFAAPGAVSIAESNLASICSAIRAAGAYVIVCTETARNTAFSGGQTTASYNTDVAAYNTWIRANAASWSDAVADIGADTRLQDASNATYFADGVHLTDAGSAIVAAAVHAALVTAGVP